MSDITIAYVVEPQKMPALHVEGIRLEPQEVAAIRKEIEENYSDISKTSSGRFNFRSENAHSVHNIEFEYCVKKHELSGRDKSIYFAAQTKQEYEYLNDFNNKWDYICKIAEIDRYSDRNDFLDSNFPKDIADPIFRYALLGKSLTTSLQSGVNRESIENFKRIVRYLSLIDHDIALIERKAIAIVEKLNSQKPRHRRIYGKKSGCLCNFFRHQS